MARARNIKPSFFTNEYLVELDPIYRLMFVGLWTLADREGRIENRPKKIKMELFPADNIDISKGLNELSKAGFILLYNCYETDVIQINNFTKHQSPHGLEKDSDLPDVKGFYTVYPRENKNPKNKCVSGEGILYNRVDYLKIKGIDENQQLKSNHDNNSYETVIEPSNNALNPECGILNPDSLNPECGINSVKPKKSKNVLRTLPDDFGISERVSNWAKKEGYENLELHLERFIETATMKVYKYADWDLAFMKAIREDWGKVNKPVYQSGYQQSTPQSRQTPSMADYMQREAMRDITPEQQYFLEHEQ